MKQFSELKPREMKATPVVQVQDKLYFAKQKMASTVDDQEIREAVFMWLLSFQGGMTKVEFQNQLVKLDKNITTAQAQLKSSSGKRRIELPPRVKPPKITDIAEALLEYQQIAIEAKAGYDAIEKFLCTLPEGGVYILDLNELILEYRDYQNRGNSAQIIEKAHKASVLIIEGLHKPVALPFHIKDTLTQLATVRKKDKDKYTLSTWNYTFAWYIPDYANLFTHFSV